ncbi:Insulin-induced protein 1 protein [Sparganum proliferum]
MNRLLLYLLRSTLLFGLGVCLYYIFGLLQGFRSGIFTDNFSLHVLRTNSGIPLCCGFLAVLGGLLSPHICNKLQQISPFSTLLLILKHLNQGFTARCVAATW